MTQSVENTDAMDFMPFQQSPSTVALEAQQAIKYDSRSSSTSETKIRLGSDHLFHEPHTESPGHFEAVKQYLDEACNKFSRLEMSASDE